LKAADADVLLIAPCGFDLARTAQEMHWLTDRPDWRELPAVRAGRVYLADGNQYFNRPGPRVVETLQIITGILRSGRSEGTGWRQVELAS
jgi:iron complex transport system substrate-binding protein